MIDATSNCHGGRYGGEQSADMTMIVLGSRWSFPKGLSSWLRSEIVTPALSSPGPGTQAAERHSA
jgi:hypothetical protein